jgi:hypothetical protein
MANFKIYKEVIQLPAILEADTVYAVRVGSGFDLYITDNTGAFAHQINDQNKWLDFLYANTSTNFTQTDETINLEGSNKVGKSSEIIFEGTTYKKFDLDDGTQSYILSITNQIIKKRYN